MRLDWVLILGVLSFMASRVGDPATDRKIQPGTDYLKPTPAVPGSTKYFSRNAGIKPMTTPAPVPWNSMTSPQMFYSNYLKGYKNGIWTGNDDDEELWVFKGSDLALTNPNLIKVFNSIEPYDEDRFHV